MRLSLNVITDDTWGHAWITIQQPDGGRDSYGFYPGSAWGALVGGPGIVQHPDNAFRAWNRFSVMVTQSAADRAIAYARRPQPNYFWLGYNCAAFAVQMFRAGTGINMFYGSPAQLDRIITQMNGQYGRNMVMSHPWTNHAPELIEEDYRNPGWGR